MELMHVEVSCLVILLSLFFLLTGLTMISDNSATRSTARVVCIVQQICLVDPRLIEVLEKLDTCRAC